MSEGELLPSDIYMQDHVVFEAGKTCLLWAESGHGKSSILNFIYGSNLDFEGCIRYDGRELKREVFSLRKEKLSYVFQDFKLFPELSVFENIALKNALTNHKTSAEIDAWIKHVQLEHKRDTPIKTLSLGQRQRVACLRALCQPFAFLLLDEPFSHVDEQNISLMCTLIQEEVNKQKAGLIVTSLSQSKLFPFDQTFKL